MLLEDGRRVCDAEIRKAIGGMAWCRCNRAATITHYSTILPGDFAVLHYCDRHAHRGTTFSASDFTAARHRSMPVRN